MMSACAASSLVGLYFGPRFRSPSTPPAPHSSSPPRVGIGLPLPHHDSPLVLRQTDPQPLHEPPPCSFWKPPPSLRPSRHHIPQNSHARKVSFQAARGIVTTSPY